ncbi:hypothetical protein VKT23_018926 [Stygiomarasmius scandens]|uniref:DUF6593 domain-containing protein n=1 Tax=Marasmiellus scandens TaxID=2682957 RepID=A0ABR1IS85_9AGAR
MKFFQKGSGLSPILNNTYYDESGRVVYKVHTPNLFINSTTTVIKFLSSSEEPNQDLTSTIIESNSEPDKAFISDEEHELPLRGGVGANEASGSRVSLVGDEEPLVDQPARTPDAETQLPSLELTEPSGSDADNDHFVYIAQIDWKRVKSSRLRFGDGKEVLAKEFFRKETWGPYGRHRVFRASDGIEYKWIMGSYTPKLVKNNSAKTPVAKFHRRNFGFWSKSKKSPPYLEIFPEGEHMVDEIFSTFIYIEKIRSEQEAAAASA